MKTRFLFTMPMTTPSGYTYEHICVIKEFNNADWKSRSHMRRRFRDIVKKDYPISWASGKGSIKVEAV